MKASWFWIGKYLIVMLVALVLGSVLAALEPFKSATLGAGRIGAGTLAQFIAQSGALALLWALGFRCSTQLRRVGGVTGPLSATVLALVTLIVVASAYGVLSRFIAPVLPPNLKPVVDWVFIAGMLAAALWLLWVLFTDSQALIEAVRSVVTDRRRPPLTQDDRAVL